MPQRARHGFCVSHLRMQLCQQAKHTWQRTARCGAYRRSDCRLFSFQDTVIVIAQPGGRGVEMDGWALRQAGCRPEARREVGKRRACHLFAQGSRETDARVALLGRDGLTVYGKELYAGQRWRVQVGMVWSWVAHLSELGISSRACRHSSDGDKARESSRTSVQKKNGDVRRERGVRGTEEGSNAEFTGLSGRGEKGPRIVYLRRCLRRGPDAVRTGYRTRKGGM